MKDFLKKYSYAIFTGITFPRFSGFYLSDWQWWFFVVGVVILVELKLIVKEK